MNRRLNAGLSKIGAGCDMHCVFRNGYIHSLLNGVKWMRNGAIFHPGCVGIVYIYRPVPTSDSEEKLYSHPLRSVPIVVRSPDRQQINSSVGQSFTASILVV